ncbi:3-phosphoshikimate 1-carboxyvinyltransferase [Pseudalkalibacillus berkeleyi]|uniref:3-phosphoshikimate 1-carboxyvinyltransferase n=1 Tax=Pseudalkalibacillus berkeleyi TaxID=1069813 RepID=A0ABS9H0Z8_9BACL|nr:3-phosphoshikimate 1-carboxyvinyltransferase [Pseudalkalibacillus berkeleyi]MCF6137571.1 3-phosphoshikimate 1-carboxyvinyltransferase [Pseudalkalibacillus berkeleyi]
MEECILHKRKSGLNGTIKVPGDKSITHRSVMFGGLAEGETTVVDFLDSEDCRSTMSCMEQLGVQINEQEGQLTIKGVGASGLTEPVNVLDVGNSGTTARLLSGILAGFPIYSVLAGDESIHRRPMSRVVNPLREMGATIKGREDGRLAPISIIGGNTKGIYYNSPIASAQVKSALLLCGLNSEGKTVVNEPHISRDHTERMLKSFGAEVIREGTRVEIQGGQKLVGTKIQIPADISSAAFFMVAAAITPNSSIKLLNVGLNPTRTGIIDVLKRMGATFSITNERMLNEEPVGDIEVSYSRMQGIEISGDIIPRLIDELPVIALLASQSEGLTTIKDASELRFKETDRIAAVAEQLNNIGITVEPTEDGMIVKGSQTVTGGVASSLGDHRIGMMLAVASCISENPISINQMSAVNISYPNFVRDLNYLSE